MKGKEEVEGEKVGRIWSDIITVIRMIWITDRSVWGKYQKSRWMYKDGGNINEGGEKMWKVKRLRKNGQIKQQ